MSVGAVMLSPQDIETIAARAAALVLAGLRGGQQVERLLTKTELAQHLAVKEAQVDRFVRRGMPRETVGSSPRFELAACRVWLADNGKRRPLGGAAAGPIPGVTPIGRAAKVR